MSSGANTPQEPDWGEEAAAWVGEQLSKERRKMWRNCAISAGGGFLLGLLVGLLF